MRVDRRFVVVLAISLTWATIVAGVFYRLASGAGSRAQAESQKQVVVASKPLVLGATIGRESLKLRAMPESMVPVGAFTKLEDVLDRPVISPIQPEETVVEARLAAKGSGMGLAPLIPSGMRAISVRVNDVVGVAGFVLPGMRVDVLVTARPPNRQDTVTRTVLQNITVLSAGQTIQTDGKSQSIIAPVVTLLVKPQEAEALTLANTEGRIQLVLRNSNDQVTAATRGRGLQEILGGTVEAVAEVSEPRLHAVRQAAPRASPPPPQVTEARLAPPPADEDRIIMIRGKVKTVESFGAESGTK